MRPVTASTLPQEEEFSNKCRFEHARESVDTSLSALDIASDALARTDEVIDRSNCLFRGRPLAQESAGPRRE
jgi:hypothetical protein